MLSLKDIFDDLSKAVNTAIDEKKSPSFPTPGTNRPEATLKCLWIENTLSEQTIAIFAESPDGSEDYTQVGLATEKTPQMYLGAECYPGGIDKKVTITASENKTLRPIKLAEIVKQISTILEIEAEHFYNLMQDLTTDTHIAEHYLNTHPNRNAPPNPPNAP